MFMAGMALVTYIFDANFFFQGWETIGTFRYQMSLFFWIENSGVIKSSLWVKAAVAKTFWQTFMRALDMWVFHVKVFEHLKYLCN